MPQFSESLSTPELDYEGWREALRPYWGRYNPVVMEPKTFTGRACLQRLYGFTAMELSCNAHRIERTPHDVRLRLRRSLFRLLSGGRRVNYHSK